jgi:hypothetical protein
MTAHSTPQSVPRSRRRQIATTAATFIAVLSIGTAAAAIADAKPKDPAVQSTYNDCVVSALDRMNGKPITFDAFKGIQFDCCIGNGLKWVGGQWNSNNGHCVDDSGNTISAPQPAPSPPPSAVMPPPGSNQIN